MSGGDFYKLLTAVLSGLPFLLVSTPAHATVYAWKSESGTLHLSNDEGHVPEARRATAEEFTAKPVDPSVPEATAPLASAGSEAALASTYERGLERGLQMAERQVALAGELARSVLAAVPPAPPVRIVIQQPAPTVIRYVSRGHRDYPFYGFIGPYVPYSPYGRFGYAYGFRRGRFVPHSHFFPGTRGRHRGVFFPRGHFSRDGFLFGHGLVVR
jgi:hypothetical protein